MRTLALTALLLGSASPAWAQDATWTVDVGAAGRVRPTHIGADRYIVDAVPVIEATYGDRVRISFDDGAKFTAFRWGAIDAGPIVEYRQSFNDHLPPGTFKMNDAVEVGGFTSATLPFGVAEARLRRAVNGYKGWSGDLSFDTGAPLPLGFQAGGQLRLSWADSNFTDQYFGLKPAAARRSSLPRFLDEDYVTAGGELDLIHPIGRRTRAILALSADRILGELNGSPLLDSRNVFTASFALTYHWSSPASGF